MGAEPGRTNQLSPITRIDTDRVRPVQSAAGRSFHQARLAVAEPPEDE